MDRDLRILHFVTGGFSGATSVAVDLAAAAQGGDAETLLVLRRKKTTDPERVAQLRARGLAVETVSGAAHILTIRELAAVCRRWQPDILVVHGFPEHILGRWAGRLAGVPHMVHIEHNSRERYTRWKLWQSRVLSRHTDCAVGVSRAVAAVLRAQGLHTPVYAIPNGIDAARFVQAAPLPLAERGDDVVMVARFAKSKDQQSLIRAVGCLKQQGLAARLLLLGGGKAAYRRRAEALAVQAGVADAVTFCSHSDEVPQILGRHKVFVMASFFEGLNLAVIEAMAAGCVVVGSDVAGVGELIDHGADGFLFPAGDAGALAALLAPVLRDPAAYQAVADAARAKALRQYDKPRVHADYRRLFAAVAAGHAGAFAE